MQIKIKDIKIDIKFMQDTTFIESPNIAIYKSICNFIKRLVCLDTNIRCQNCNQNNKCIYSFLTGKDFNEFQSVPFIVSYGRFNKLEYIKDESYEFYLTLIGDAIEFYDFIIFTLKEFEKNGLFKEKYIFKIMSIEINDDISRLCNNSTKIQGLKILTPVIFENDILFGQHKRLKYLNEKFNIISFIEDYIKPVYNIKISYFFSPKRRFGGNYITDNGFIADLEFPEGIILNNFLNLSIIIGFGKYNFFNGRNVDIILED